MKKKKIKKAKPLKKEQVDARFRVDNKEELMKGHRARNAALFYLIFFASICYILWRIFFTLPLEYGIASIICSIVLVCCEAVTIVETFTHFNNARKVKFPEMPVIPDDMYPTVDVMIATHNEDTDLMYKTINGCQYMKYPDKSKVTICVCDDKNRPEMKELCQKMGVEYFGFDGNKHAKAGNLNYALPQTHSELIAIFDADMIPTSDFLLETVPYFFSRDMIKDEKTGEWRKRTENDEPSKEKELGYVQTQQSFYNPDPLQRNLYMEGSAPNEQDYFYRSVNVARMHSESSAFAGSNTLFSRRILEEVGGFATHSITEDFATSIPILGKGYRSIAVAKELAHGLSPEDVYGFIKQRQRWSRGAAQGIMTKHFWFSGMKLKQKWAFLVAYGYWWTFVRRFIFVLSPILYALFNIRFADVTFLQIMAIWLPYYIIYNLGLKIMSGETTSALWSDRIDTIQFPYMIGPIIKGTLMIPQKTFFVTPKDRQTGKNSNIKLAWPHIILTILTLVTISICINQLIVDNNGGAPIVLFWAFYNLFALVSAIVYYAGRENARYSERVPVPIPVEIHYANRIIHANTSDVSEGGMAIKISNPEYLPYDEDFFVKATFKNYESHMRLTVVQVRKDDDGWLYSTRITEIDDYNKGEYMQILYDRSHLFPRIVDVGIVKDFRIIFAGLTQKPKSGERRLPRIDFKKDFPIASGGSVYIIDFNFKYLTLKKTASTPAQLSIMFPGNIEVKCSIDEELNQKKGLFDSTRLYKIENWEELIQRDEFRTSLHSIVSEIAKANEN